jgi:hypothetical protein
MNNSQSQALTETRNLVRDLEQFIADGWSLTKHATTVHISATGDSEHLLACIQRLARAANDAKLLGDFGGLSLTIEVDRAGQALVTDRTPGDLSTTFAAPNLDAARDAWEGDLPSALSLDGEWSASLELDLALLLRASDRSRVWYILLDQDDAQSLLEASPFWELGPLVSADKPLVILIANAAPNLRVQTATMQIQALHTEPLQLIEIAEIARQAPLTPVPNLPDPRCLAPISVERSDEDPLTTCLWRLAAAACWVWLATDARPTTANGGIDVEYFGLQRVNHEIGPAGPDVSDTQARATLDLWRWATHVTATDQLLATRQVLSLYRDSPPWDRAGDVKRASESVFLALRGDAVAEAFKARREARTLALTVGRQTGEATAALAKGAVERCLASLLTVGAVIVARSTDAISRTQADKLHMLLGVVLFLLALWSIFVEGPPVTAASRGLRRDLDKFSDLLTRTDRDDVDSLTSLETSRSQAKRVRWLVPIAYSAAGLAALLIH